MISLRSEEKKQEITVLPVLAKQTELILRVRDFL